MQIDYEYYKVFYHVAKLKSFTLAANALFMNQPNVTRIIKNLENQLQCILFSRSRRSVELTPEGEKLYFRLRIAIEQIQAAEEELALDKSLQRGVISIGASDTALYGILLRVLKEYRRAYPGVKVKMSNYSTPQALAALKNGFIDFAVVTTPLDLSDSMTSREIKNYRDIVVAGGEFSALHGRKLSLKALCDYPIVCLGQETNTYKFFQRFFREHGLAFAPDIEVTTVDQILPLVKNNLGLGFIPEFFLAEKSGQEIFSLTICEELPRRSICLVKRKDQILSLAAKELERMLFQTKI